MDEQIARQNQESGVLLVDKPTDWTSHDVVSFVRRFGIKKVGHCGTLDPAATGLLVLVLGRATKIADRLSGQDKTYEAVMEIGKETFTQDAEGEITAETDWSAVTEEQIHAACTKFKGEIEQIPPMVSAKKQDGKRLYKLARKGIEVERQPRPITIHELTVDNVSLPNVSFMVHCSKGTYVRTLCYDIGKVLGCGAFLKVLRRTQSGSFHIKDAFDMETIRSWNREMLLANFIPLEKALSYI